MYQYQCPYDPFSYAPVNYNQAYMGAQFRPEAGFGAGAGYAHPGYVHQNYANPYYQGKMLHPSTAFYPPFDGFTRAQVNLMNLMRMLWEQHDVWTRSAIVSIVFSLPDKDPVISRLLRNPEDFGDALKPFYGERIASEFSDLLKNHLVIASQLVQAAKAGNNKAAAEAEKKWYANADKIADLLGRINPYWSSQAWKIMLHRHLELVKAEAVDMLTKKYESAVAVYDEIEKQTLKMADVMSKGIIQQFPHKL